MNVDEIAQKMSKLAELKHAVLQATEEYFSILFQAADTEAASKGKEFLVRRRGSKAFTIELSGTKFHFSLVNVVSFPGNVAYLSDFEIEQLTNILVLEQHPNLLAGCITCYEQFEGSTLALLSRLFVNQNGLVAWEAETTHIAFEPPPPPLIVLAKILEQTLMRNCRFWVERDRVLLKDESQLSSGQTKIGLQRRDP